MTTQIADTSEQRNLLAAANSYANKFGQDALAALLEALAGVQRIVDVQPQDRNLVLVSLLNDDIKAMAARRQKREDWIEGKATIDPAAIYSKWNSAKRRA